MDYNLYNNVRRTEYVPLKVAWLMNDELERMWKKPVKAYFKVLSWGEPGGIEKKNMKYPNHDLDSNRPPPKC
jgi:hypothetical protein